MYSKRGPWGRGGVSERERTHPAFLIFDQHTPEPDRPGGCVAFDCWSVSVPFIHGGQKIVMMY